MSVNKGKRVRRDGLPAGSGHGLVAKRQAATAYVLTGNQRAAARAIGARESLIRKWRGTSWWQDMVSEITADIGRQHRASIARTYGKALAALENRIEAGDCYRDSQGEVYRLPVRSRELVIAADRLHSQLRLSEGLPTAIRGQAESLPALAAQFAALAGRREAPEPGAGGENSSHPIIDVTPSQIVDGRPDVPAED